MKNCKSCKYRKICPQTINWTNEYGLITKKELTCCSQYDKDMSCKYDLTDLYKIIFEFDDVIYIMRKEYVGNLQMCAETKLYIICKDGLFREAEIRISEKIWHYKEEYNLELDYYILTKSQIQNRNLEDMELIERVSFYDKEN